MVARIYQPARNPMQSGQSGSDVWMLEFISQGDKPIDPLMGWIGTTDTRTQVKMRFHTQEEAVDYAERHGLDYIISQPKKRRHRPRGYGDNFATSRRGAWTH